jgi:hypothetical protein
MGGTYNVQTTKWCSDTDDGTLLIQDTQTHKAHKAHKIHTHTQTQTQTDTDRHTRVYQDKHTTHNTQHTTHTQHTQHTQHTAHKTRQDTKGGGGGGGGGRETKKERERERSCIPMPRRGLFVIWACFFERQHLIRRHGEHLVQEVWVLLKDVQRQRHQPFHTVNSSSVGDLGVRIFQVRVCVDDIPLFF